MELDFFPANIYWMSLPSDLDIWVFISGWWCQTFFFFYFPSHICDVTLPIDFHIFHKGWSATNQICFFSLWVYHRIASAWVHWADPVVTGHTSKQLRLPIHSPPALRSSPAVPEKVKGWSQKKGGAVGISQKKWYTLWWTNISMKNHHV